MMIRKLFTWRPNDVPFGQWLGDFSPKPNRVEMALINACVHGKRYSVAETCPRENEGSDGNVIRASIIRFLILGGDILYPAHQCGVFLEGAWISGQLDLTNCIGSTNIRLVRCYFHEKVLTTGSSFTGLNLNGSRVPCINADRMKISGNVLLGEGFEAHGTVSFVNAIIGGNFDCHRGYFTAPGGDALNAALIRVNGSVFLNDGFIASGRVVFQSGNVKGTFTCSNGKFHNSYGYAIYADRIVVEGTVNLLNGFDATGEVRFLGASIGSNFQCNGGNFLNIDNPSLTADGIKVNGDVFLNEKFNAKGEVRFYGAIIGGNFECYGGIFSKSDNSAESIALNLRSANIKGIFMLCKTSTSNEKKIKNEYCYCMGDIDLTSTHVTTLRDSNEKDKKDLPECWSGGQNKLDGFTYDYIDGSYDAALRIKWLKTQLHRDDSHDGFRSQPWEFLIKVLRDDGQSEELKAVAIEKKRLLRKTVSNDAWREPHGIYDAVLQIFQHLFRKIYRIINVSYEHLLDILIGYGYKPLRVVFVSISIVVICSLCYQNGYSNGYFAPTNAQLILKDGDRCGPPGDFGTDRSVDPRMGPIKKHTWNEPGCLPPEYTSFQPFWYSLDLLLPVVDLGQDGDWSPLTSNTTGETFWCGVFLRWLGWSEILSGWVIILIFSAYLSNIIQRD
ncbi:hypothetical protein ACM0P6_14245 (plasmid) [Komagataeibacter sucrofermentans]|uniref:hypothetical protein n=1 Tax=Komagataeibacter sucrofermentans TaxID=1053551 RepID=UPI0011B6D50F|nr:hypothetical protein [Komagataeibacter sucrofermentans]GBQ51664.1 membrane-associated oxidoreductase [Komagataeibacter sucrofermentans DSM 15973]